MKKKKPPAKNVTVEKPLSLGQKIGTTLACLLFAAGFGAGGVVGIGGLGYHAYGWYTTRSWQPIMAEVTAAELHTSSGRKSTTYRIEAKYRYDVGGVAYTGTRVGFGDQMADNIGDWHEDHFAELDAARKNGRRVLAWFDPANPAESVIDRSVRWGIMLFFVPFAVLFSGISIAGLWTMVNVWRST